MMLTMAIVSCRHAEQKAKRGKTRQLTTAHLLRDHNNTRRPRSPADAGNRKQLEKSRDHAAVDVQPSLADHDLLLLQESVDVVQITSGLELRVAETDQGVPRRQKFALFHIPTWGFWAEPSS